MWRTAPLWLSLAGVLAACDPMANLSGPLPNSVTLAGSVGVSAPEGYCVDPVVTRPRQGFALLAACAAMTADDTDAYPATIALITVQVGGIGSAIVAGQEDDFRIFLETPQGAALLGASAIGGPLAVRDTGSADNAVQVYTEDTGAPGVVGTQAQAWRLFTDVGGRLVTVSVRGLSDTPLSQAGSRAMLDRMLVLLRAANIAAATPA